MSETYGGVSHSARVPSRLDAHRAVVMTPWWANSNPRLTARYTRQSACVLVAVLVYPRRNVRARK